MTTYVYETIPQKAGQKPKKYELRQSMRDAAFTHHPETGEPIKRVLLGGFGYSGKSSYTKAVASGGGGCGCGHGGCPH